MRLRSCYFKEDINMEAKQQDSLKMPLLKYQPTIPALEEQQYVVEKYLLDAKKTSKRILLTRLGLMTVWHGSFFWLGEILCAVAFTMNASFVYKSFIIAFTAAIFHSVFRLFLILFNLFNCNVQIGKIKNDNNNRGEIIENINNAKTENNFFRFLIFSIFSHATIVALTCYMCNKLGWKIHPLDIWISYLFEWLILLMLILPVMIIAYYTCLKNTLHVKTDHPRLCDDQYKLKAEGNRHDRKKDEKKISQRQSKYLLRDLRWEKINKYNLFILRPQHFLSKDKNGKYRRDNLFSRKDELGKVFNNFFNDGASIPDNITDLITDFEGEAKLKFKIITL